MTTQLKVLAPTPIADAQFVSSVVAEADNPAWSSGTTYAAGAKVMYQHRNYESLQASNTNHLPDEVASTWWLTLGPTNRWGMFDTIINTPTSLATSVGTPALTATVAPGVCNGVAVLDIVNAQSVTVSMTNGATTVYSETQSLDNTYISDWYEFWFSPYDVKSDVLFGPLPPYPSAHITVTATPNVVGDTVAIGAALYGNTVEIGMPLAGARAGIVDYSRITTDDFGVSTLVQRSYAKKTNFDLIIENTQLRRVYSTLAALRATPAVWVGSDNYQLSPLVVFGYYKDFSINVAYATHSTATLEITGMI